MGWAKPMLARKINTKKLENSNARLVLFRAKASTRAMTRATTRATAKVVMADGRLGAVETRELCRWRIRMNSVNQICMLKLRNIRAAWTCHFPICGVPGPLPKLALVNSGRELKMDRFFAISGIVWLPFQFKQLRISCEGFRNFALVTWFQLGVDAP